MLGSRLSPRTRLDLLSTPALVRLAHVRRRLDGRDELQGHVSDTGEANQGGGDDAEHVVVQQNGANEDVDCEWVSLTLARRRWDRSNLQTPRPRKENKKEA